MLIPEVGEKINYRYYSSLLTMNIVLTVEKAKHGCKILIMEGPFIGKYFALIYEDESKVSLLAWGKGLYYGDIKKDNLSKPLFVLDKLKKSSGDMPIGDQYIINYNIQGESIRAGTREYSDCIRMTVVYDKGKYLIWLKEGFGLILIQNIVNNIIKDEIRIQEA